MKLFKNNLNNISLKKTNALRLITLIFVFCCLDNMPNIYSKNLGGLSATEENLNENTLTNKIEDQPLQINLFNNLTYFVGSADGLLSLKSEQLNIKNHNYYSAVLNFKMNKTDIDTIQNLQLKNTIIKDQKLVRLNDFLEYFPNMGKMVSDNEMSIDLRYLWKCQYERKVDGLIYTMDTDFITKESSTQHGFKVQFKITDKTTYLPAIKTFFENMVSNCKATQKSAIELKRALHKLMVKYLNIKTLMRILKEKKNGKNVPAFTKIPINPAKKSRENTENLEKNSALAPNKTRLESLAPNKTRLADDDNKDNNSEDVAVINVNADDINNGETLTEVDDDSEAMRLFFLEKGEVSLSNTENEDELVEASFLENSENKLEAKNSTIALAKSRVNEEIKAQAANANEEKGFFGKATSLIGGLFGKGKKAAAPAPAKPAATPKPATKPAGKPKAKGPKSAKGKKKAKAPKAPKTPAELLIKKPNTNVPLTPEQIKDPVAKLKYDKKEDELKATEKAIVELQTKKSDLKKNIKDMQGKQVSEEQNKDILKGKLAITKQNLKKSKLVISMTQTENKKLTDKIKTLTDIKTKLTAVHKSEKDNQDKKKKDLDLEKGVMDDQKKDKTQIRSKVTDLGEKSTEQGKKLKSVDEVKNELLKNIKEAKLKGDNLDKEIGIKNDEIKSKQNEFDDMTMKIKKSEESQKKQAKAIEELAQKIQETSGKIDKKAEEDAVKAKSDAIMKLNPMEKTLAAAKDALKAVMDPKLQTIAEEAYNVVIDKQNNDITNYLKKVKELPTIFTV